MVATSSHTVKPAVDGPSWCGCGCPGCAPAAPAGPPLRLVPAPGEARRRRLPRLQVPLRLAAAGVLLGFLPAALFVWAVGGADYGDSRVGLRAAPFTLPLLGTGHPYGSGDLRGRPAVVVFWSPRCPPCVEELRGLQDAWDRHGRTFAVVGVQVGAIADAEATALVEAIGVAFPNVIDRSGAVAGSFGLMGVPEAHFLDATLRVVAVDRGEHVIGVDQRRGLVHWSPIPPPVLDRRLGMIVPTTRGQL